MTCAPSVLLCQGLEDKSSSYAEEGSAAHAVAAAALTNPDGPDLGIYVGMFYSVDLRKLVPEELHLPADVEITTDMVDDLRPYIDAILKYAEGNTLAVETKVDLSTWLGPDQFGTSDATILVPADFELQVHDLKFGRGLRVDAIENEQLMLYALGVYDEYCLGNDIRRIRLVIHQPRLQHLSEWDCSVEHLLEFGERARKAGAKALDIAETGIFDESELVVSDAGCKFCKVKATCPAMVNFVQETVGADFEDLTKEHVESAAPGAEADALATYLSAVNLIEGWCKAVRAEVETRLLAGTAVGDYKLVRGKRGARAWNDEAEVEKLFKETFRLKADEMYQFKLLSPTQIEKRLKTWTDGEGIAREPILGPRQRTKLDALVVQADGALSVAPGSDPRPAYVPEPVVFEPVPPEPVEGDLG